MYTRTEEQKERNRQRMRDRYYEKKGSAEAKAAKRKSNKSRIAKATAYVKRLKGFMRCLDCGYSFKGRTECCDFHHLDPSQKDGQIQNFYNNSIAKVKAELRKCVPLCANCHRIRHAKERAEATLS